MSSSSNQPARYQDAALERRMAAYRQVDRSTAGALHERIENGYQLTHHAMGRAMQLDLLVLQVASEQPERLEQLREIQDSFVMGCKWALARYMAGTL